MILDHQERTLALDPSQSWIVQAPAGSGKTELLVGRFLAILSLVNEPEEVLALTFTKKAASEMEARILQALVNASEGRVPKAPHERTNFELAQKVLNQDQKKHWRLLENTRRLRVSTIDSFCAYLTAQLPISAKFGENFEVTDLPDCLYEESIDQLLESLKETLPFSQALKKCLFYLDNRLDRFKNLLKNMLARRSMWLDVILKIDDSAEWEKVLTRSVGSIIQEAIENLELEWPEALNLDLYIQNRSLEELQKLANLLLTEKNTLRKKVDKRLGFLPKSEEKKVIEAVLENLEKYPAFIEELIHIRSLPVYEFTQEGWILMQDWVSVLKAATAYLQIVFQTHKTVDFSEIALNALEALGGEDSPTDILLRLDHQVSHLLVDEYQDTSQHQYRLLSAMIRGWEEGEGRSIFLVGDPMQSIYRFRQAEVGLFLKTIDEGLGNITLGFLQLKVNFRSVPGVVKWINQTFEKLFPQKKAGLFGAVTYSASVSASAFDFNYDFNSDFSELNNSVNVVLNPSIQALAQDLAQRIHEHCLNFPKDRIAILVRARTHLEYVLPALSKLNIHYQGIEIERLQDNPVVLDALNLTYALYDLKDNLSWMALLRSPVFGFELKDLLILSEGLKPEQSVFEKLECSLKESSALSIHAQTKLKILFPRIKNILQTRYRESVYSLVKRLWSALGFELCESAQRYFELLKKLRPSHRLIERKILEKLLENLYAKSEELNKKDHFSVEVMTIHKSKGLEFDHVFLWIPNQASRVLDKPLLLWQDRVNSSGEHELLMAPHRGKEKEDSPLYQFLYSLEKEKEQRELIRLLYVAATRAKSYLTVMGEVEFSEEGEIKKPKAGSSLSILWPAINPVFRKEDLQKKECVEKNLLATSTRESGLMRIPIELDLGFEIPSLLDISDISDISEALDVSNDQDLNNHLNHPEIPEYFLEDKIFGTIAHQCLEQLARLAESNQNKNLPEDINFWEKHLRVLCLAKGVNHPEPMAKNIINVCNQVLSDPIGQWILNSSQDVFSDQASELSLWENTPWGVQERIIDRTFVDYQNNKNKNGVRIIIDYKFSKPDEKNEKDQNNLNNLWENFVLKEREKYRSQLEKYVDLMQKKMRASQEYREIKAYLYFPWGPRLVQVI